MNFTTDSKVLVQGITEPIGQIYVPLMKAYGTPLVAGVSPGCGGETLQDLPIFDLVEQAIEAVGPIDTTLICCPPYQMLDAALEAMEAEIRQMILLGNGIPPLDMVRLLQQAETTETLVIGPNSPGIIIPDQILLGIHPSECYTPGSVGLVSRSGTLTFEVAQALTQAGLGQSMSIGIGNDTIVGSSFSQWLQILDEDEQTDVIVLIGEIGGDSEEQAAQYIRDTIDKPVIAYVAGLHAPKDEFMGHASAIIASQAMADTSFAHENFGTAESKVAALKQAKVPVAQSPSQVPELVQKARQTQQKQARRRSTQAAKN